MSNININQINEYITNNRETTTVVLEYGDFQVKVKTSLSVGEQHNFIQEVFDNAYIDRITPSAE